MYYASRPVLFWVLAVQFSVACVWLVLGRRVGKAFDPWRNLLMMGVGEGGGRADVKKGS
jgi:hypothetical protein